MDNAPMLKPPVPEAHICALEEISVIARYAIGMKSLIGMRNAMWQIDIISDRILGEIS